MKSKPQYPNPMPRYEVSNIQDLRDMLRQSREKYGTRNAFLIKKQRGEAYIPVTYESYAQDVDRIGTFCMEKLQLLPGTSCALLGNSQYEWYVAYLALANGASRVVPLDKELPAHELAGLLHRSHVQALIAAPALLSKLQEALQILQEEEKIELKSLLWMEDTKEKAAEFQRQWPQIQVFYWNEALEQGSKLIETGCRSFLDWTVDREEARILLFTSGTTARSKAVLHNHKAIATNLMAMRQYVEIKPEDLFFSILPLHHTYECTCGFLCPIYSGACIAQCEGLRYIQKNMKECHPTVLLAVPLIAETFDKRIQKQIDKKVITRQAMQFVRKISRKLCEMGLDQRRKFFAPVLSEFGGALRLLIVGGAKIKEGVLERFRDYGITAIQGYGLTECAPILALNPDQYPKDEAAGLPLPGVELRLHEINEEGIGEFIARGDNIMLGYFEDEEATREALDAEGFYHTGDLGYVDEDGYLILTGRKKNVIVTDNGKNIYPEELEALFLNEDEVQECVVFGEKNAQGMVQIAIEIFPDLEILSEKLGVQLEYDSPEVLEFMQKLVNRSNQKVPNYKNIRSCKIRATEFEKNTSKKIKRKQQEI